MFVGPLGCNELLFASFFGWYQWAMGHIRSMRQSPWVLQLCKTGPGVYDWKPKGWGGEGKYKSEERLLPSCSSALLPANFPHQAGSPTRQGFQASCCKGPASSRSYFQAPDYIVSRVYLGVMGLLGGGYSKGHGLVVMTCSDENTNWCDLHRIRLGTALDIIPVTAVFLARWKTSLQVHSYTCLG